MQLHRLLVSLIELVRCVNPLSDDNNMRVAGEREQAIERSQARDRNGERGVREERAILASSSLWIGSS